MGINLQSIFDKVGDITNDPQFSTGLGLIGAASPVRNAPAMAAFQALQSIKKAQVEAASKQSENEYRKAQAERAAEQTKLYGEQVRQQGRNIDMQSAQQAMIQPAMRGFLKMFGFATPENAATPATPNAAPEASMPVPGAPAIPSPVAPVNDLQAANLPRLDNIKPLSFPNTEAGKVANLFVNGAPPDTLDSINQRMSAIEGNLKRGDVTGQSKAYLESQYTKLAEQRDGMMRTAAAAQAAPAAPIAAQPPAPTAIPPISMQPGQPGQGMDPYRAVQAFGGVMQIADPKNPAAGFATLGNAIKPEHLQPGTFIRDMNGNMTQVPDRLGEGNLAVKQGELGLAQNRDIRAAQDQALKQATQKATDFGEVSSVLDSTARLTAKAAALAHNPALGRITGVNAMFPNAPGSPASNAQADLDQLGSQILLSTITSLKSISKNGSTGFGQLSNVEGEHLRNSVSSLKQSQNAEQMQTRLGEVVKAANQTVDRAVEVFERTHNASPYDGLPVGTRPARDSSGVQLQSRNGNPLLKLPNGKLVEAVQQ